MNDPRGTTSDPVVDPMSEEAPLEAQLVGAGLSGVPRDAYPVGIGRGCVRVARKFERRLCRQSLSMFGVSCCSNLGAQSRTLRFAVRRIEDEPNASLDKGQKPSTRRERRDH
jgi:hypothetical protein